MKYLSALAAVLIAVTRSAYATEYLQNGSFETGDVSGWNLTDPLGLTSVQRTTFAYGAQSGNFYVYAPSPEPSVLAQTFADTAGQQLTISGWAIGDTSTPDGLGEVSYFLMASCWGRRIFRAETIRSRPFKLQPRDPIGSQFSLRMTIVRMDLIISL